jgi:flagellar biosynthesis/type III secretory pathway protein FliH
MAAHAFTYGTLVEPVALAVTAAERRRAAEDVVARAHAEAEQIRAAAQQAGFEAGRAEALAAAQPAAEAFAAAARQQSATVEDLTTRTDAAAVEQALRIADQALGAAVAADPERVLDVVRGALRRLVERERVLLLVHPDDLEIVRERVADLVGELGGIEHCEVQAERRVARGGAVVRTEEGEVDATLDTKLARAREVLEDELAAGQATRPTAPPNR